MAFGINRQQLKAWKNAVRREEIAFLTHYWLDERFPDSKYSHKSRMRDVEKLITVGKTVWFATGMDPRTRRISTF